MTLKAQAFAAVRWTSAVTIIRVVLQTVQLIVLARLIAPEDFGLMAMVISVTAFIQIFADMGVSNSIIHARVISHEVLSTLYWLNLLVGAALSAAVWVASPFISRFYDEPALALPLALSGLSFLFLSIGQQVKVLAEKRMAFKPVALVEMVSAFVSSATAIVAAFLGAGVYSLVLGVLAMSLLNSLLYLTFARDGWYPRMCLRLADAAPHLRAGVYMLGTSIANTATLQADVVIVGRLLGATALGAYTVPRELCLKVMLATNPIMTRVGTPLMANAQQDKAMLRRIYLSTIRMTSSVNFPIYGFIALFRHEVTDVVFGAKWAGSAELLGLMAIWGMFRSLGNPVGSLLYGTGNNRLAFIQSLAVGVSIVPVIILGGKWGVEGVAIALTAFYIGFTIALWATIVRPLTEATFQEYMLQFLIPLIIVAVTCVPAYFFSSFFALPITRLVAGSIAGAIAYIALSIFYNKEFMSSVLSMVRRK